MIEYFLGLKEPLTVKELKPLIGQAFAAREMTKSWGKDVVDLDKIVITNIQITVDVETENGDRLMIYSDYYLAGRKKYNAWTELNNIQKYVSDAVKEGEFIALGETK